MDGWIPNHPDREFLMHLFLHEMGQNWSHWGDAFWRSLAEVLSPGHALGEVLVFETLMLFVQRGWKRWHRRHDAEVHGIEENHVHNG